MQTSEYLESISKRFKSGISKEHAYRSDLEQLIRTLVDGVDVTNEPANVTDCGNPDYVITKKKIPIGYIEAKDVDKDLNNKVYKEQFTRYKNALDNLIITDYILFQFFDHGKLVFEIRIGKAEGKKIIPLPENFSEFENRIIEFCDFVGQTIKSSTKLAEMMAGKARLLQDILEKVVINDEEKQENSSLQDQYKSFKKILIHDLKPKEFADIYAQTLAYGMFAARLHDPSLDNFTRQEASELIPKTNPFLRKLFGHVAGPDIDERIKTTVDNLADVFRATDVDGLLKNFGKSTQTEDAIIHFYETFLAKYDPKLRKSRGVWYTPEPVVKFIVRAVDDILKTEFGINKGLADTSKVKIKIPSQDKKKEIEEEVHKVQILDPAVGTGTFLAEVIKHIYTNHFEKMKGAWSGYVEEHLIPRLNGFEILMASYAMAHLKLDMLLTEKGYKPQKNQRFNIYLTNSLEEYHPDTGTLFASWLSAEANEANHIKRDTPVMVVMGNPPYAVSSSNKGEWIQNLLVDYKKNLNERNIQPLSDDYIKFIRYGQHLINKNGEGILAYISNNSFIDGIIHRQMRKNLLETFDKIYIIDLHGSSKKKETCPDGSRDENVFDITQGVSINIFVKTSINNKKLGVVKHYDSYGLREKKYDFLKEKSLKDIDFEELKNDVPYYFFVPKDFGNNFEKKNSIKLRNLFIVNSMGIATGKDSELVFFSQSEQSEYDSNCLKHFYYRPFDVRYTLFDNRLLQRARFDLMRNYIVGDNIGLNIVRQSKLKGVEALVNTTLSNRDLITNHTYNLPLYLYPDPDEQETLADTNQPPSVPPSKGGLKRIPNLDKQIVAKIAKGLGLTFIPEKEKAPGTFAPIDILDYIYAVLHSPTYRTKYKEFLKIDFPRVPYPKDKKVFWSLVKLGGELRQIHLLQTPKVEEFITGYPIDGDNIITRKLTKTSIGWELTNKKKLAGRVWINDTQYFENVPLIAWEFYIGGYQPAQKWLKDRRNRKLEFEDILHYQKIIVALCETNKIMKIIDKIKFE